MCAKVAVIVNDLKKANPEIIFNTKKVGDEASLAAIKEAKVKGHGIIARDGDGILVTTVDGHSYGEEKVQEVIDQLLGKVAASSSKWDGPGLIAK